MITLAVIFVMATIGIPVMSFMYGVDFEQFRGLSYIMIAAGGVTAIIDFIYQVITVLRRQKSVMKLYVITLASRFLFLFCLSTYGLARCGNWVPDCNDHFARAASVGVCQYPLGTSSSSRAGRGNLAGEEAAARAYEEALPVLGLVARERRVARRQKLRELPM